MEMNSKEMITNYFLKTVVARINNELKAGFGYIRFNNICDEVLSTINGGLIYLSVGHSPAFRLIKKGDNIQNNINVSHLTSNLFYCDSRIKDEFDNGHISLEEFNFLKKIKSLKQDCVDEYCQGDARDVANSILEIIDEEYELYPNIDTLKNLYNVNTGSLLDETNIAGDLSQNWKQVISEIKDNSKKKATNFFLNTVNGCIIDNTTIGIPITDFESICNLIFSFIDYQHIELDLPGFHLIKKDDSAQNYIAGHLADDVLQSNEILENKLNSGDISLEEFNFLRKVKSLKQEYNDEYCRSNPRDVVYKIFEIIDEEYELYPHIYDEYRRYYQDTTNFFLDKPNIAGELSQNWNQMTSLIKNNSKEMTTEFFLNTVNKCVNHSTITDFESICRSIFSCIDGRIADLPEFHLRRKGYNVQNDIGGHLADGVLQSNETLESKFNNGDISLEEFNFFRKIKSLKQEYDDEYCQNNPSDVVNRIFEIIDEEYELYPHISYDDVAFYKRKAIFVLDKANIAGDLSQNWKQMTSVKKTNSKEMTTKAFLQTVSSYLDVDGANKNFEYICRSIFVCIDGRVGFLPGFDLIEKGDSSRCDIGGQLSYGILKSNETLESSFNNGNISLGEYNFLTKIKSLKQEYDDEYCQSNPGDVANRIFEIIDSEYELFPHIYDEDKEIWQEEASFFLDKENIAGDLSQNWNQMLENKSQSFRHR